MLILLYTRIKNNPNKKEKETLEEENFEQKRQENSSFWCGKKKRFLNGNHGIQLKRRS